jgi:hypothetical protein
MEPKPSCAEWILMMKYDERCKSGPIKPLNISGTHCQPHLATLASIPLCNIATTKIGDITVTFLASFLMIIRLKDSNLSVGRINQELSESTRLIFLSCPPINEDMLNNDSRYLLLCEVFILVIYKHCIFFPFCVRF